MHQNGAYQQLPLDLCWLSQVAEELQKYTQEHDAMLSERQVYEERLRKVCAAPFVSFRHSMCCCTSALLSTFRAMDPLRRELMLVFCACSAEMPNTTTSTMLQWHHLLDAVLDERKSGLSWDVYLSALV